MSRKTVEESAVVAKAWQKYVTMVGRLNIPDETLLALKLSADAGDSNLRPPANPKALHRRPAAHRAMSPSKQKPLEFLPRVLRGGRDLKLCVKTGPTGTERDSANDSALLRLVQDGESEPRRTGEGCACHNVTDDRAELIALVLSTALAKWHSSADPEELRGILLRLLVALEAPA